jgi:hypothetical protein
MAVTKGRLERLIKADAAWGMSLTESGGGGTNAVTIAAADDTYYWSSVAGSVYSVVGKIKAQLEAQSVTNGNSNTYTVTVSDGESAATGKLTIAVSAGTFTLTAVSASLNALMGGVGPDWTSGSAASTTSTYHVEGLWQGSCPKVSPYGDNDEGWLETDARSTESPAGHVKTLYGTKKTVLSLSWDHCTAAKARAAAEATADTSNESFETFWIDCILAEKSWAQGAGGPIRVVWDADNDSVFDTYKISGDLLREYRPVQVIDRWTGLYSIQIPRMVLVP